MKQFDNGNDLHAILNRLHHLKSHLAIIIIIRISCSCLAGKAMGPFVNVFILNFKSVKVLETFMQLFAKPTILAISQTIYPTLRLTSVSLESPSWPVSSVFFSFNWLFSVYKKYRYKNKEKSPIGSER